MIRRPPRSTLFPSPPLFRSVQAPAEVRHERFRRVRGRLRRRLAARVPARVEADDPVPVPERPRLGQEVARAAAEAVREDDDGPAALDLDVQPRLGAHRCDATPFPWRSPWATFPVLNPKGGPR